MGEDVRGSTRVGGRYLLVREIGLGAMGRVFQAVDTETGQAVAAKILVAGAEIGLPALLRFQQEGAVLSALKHPNIVRVYGTHLEEHSSSIIMELLEGRSLGLILRSERLPLRRTKHIMRQVAAALAYAHQQGVVHRDIKPDNIMIVGDDRVKVTDFGIARVVQEGMSFATLTSTGSTIGTPLYMSPEQVEGLKVDGRSDIYSFGCVLYEMVTGRPPFEGNSPLTIAFKHVHKAPDPPEIHNPHLPTDWNALILRCLAKDPNQRYQGVATLDQAVEALGDDARPPNAAHTSLLSPMEQTGDTEAQWLDVDALVKRANEQEQAGDVLGALDAYRAAIALGLPVSSVGLSDTEVIRKDDDTITQHPKGTDESGTTLEPEVGLDAALPERSAAERVNIRRPRPSKVYDPPRDEVTYDGFEATYRRIGAALSGAHAEESLGEPFSDSTTQGIPNEGADEDMSHSGANRQLITFYIGGLLFLLVIWVMIYVIYR